MNLELFKADAIKREFELYRLNLHSFDTGFGEFTMIDEAQRLKA